MESNNIIDTEKIKIRHIKDNAEIRIYFNPELTNENEIINKLNNYDSLLEVAKQSAFIFGNEANYPEGTMGYRLAQTAKAAIQKAEQ